MSSCLNVSLRKGSEDGETTDYQNQIVDALLKAELVESAEVFNADGIINWLGIKYLLEIKAECNHRTAWDAFGQLVSYNLDRIELDESELPAALLTVTPLHPTTLKGLRTKGVLVLYFNPRSKTVREAV